MGLKEQITYIIENTIEIEPAWNTGIAGSAASLNGVEETVIKIMALINPDRQSLSLEVSNIKSDWELPKELQHKSDIMESIGMEHLAMEHMANKLHEKYYFINREGDKK